MTIRSYKDLRVWQISMDLVESVYGLAQTFPAGERYGLVGQIQRAAVSIPSNIAEGHARQHRKEYMQHLSIAQASLAELETQLEIARRLKYVSTEETSRIQEPLDTLGKQLRALQKALAK